MKTDMPEKIYANIDRKGSYWNEYNPDPTGALNRNDTEYTRSDLCVTRSEYDKLKQHADRLADNVSYLLPMAKAHAFNNDVGSNVQICKEATDELAEYRKETE